MRFLKDKNNLLYFFYFCNFTDLLAYVLTEELAPREIEGPPNPLGLGEIISNALPPELCSKKELKPNDFMVSFGII